MRGGGHDLVTVCDTRVPVDERAVVLHLCGPVRVSVGEKVVAPGGPRECGVLAALALGSSGRVSVDRLIAWIWDEESPPSARKSIQNAVMLLRRALGPVGLGITRSGDSYQLQLADAVVDFDGLAGEAPLEGLNDTLLVIGARARLDELRFSAVERRTAEALAADPRVAIAALEALVADYPLRESFWGMLMIARYRTGAQVDALDTYQRGRRALIEGAGVEPGPQLRELEGAILQHAPELLESSPDRARGLLDEGRARARAGDVAGARTLLEEAVGAARAAGDDDVFVDIACALAGTAQWLIGDAALEALLEEARARLGSPPRDASRAARLDAGLTLMRATRGDDRAKVHGAEGISLTDQTGSREDRTAALFAQAIAWEGPDDVDARAANGDALLEHGRRSGDVVAVAFGHQYRGWAYLERGEFASASAERAAALRASASGEHPHLAAQMADTAFLTALLEGDFALATSLTREVATTWRQSADPAIAWTVDICCRLFLYELTGGMDALLPRDHRGRQCNARRNGVELRRGADLRPRRRYRTFQCHPRRPHTIAAASDDPLHDMDRQRDRIRRQRCTRRTHRGSEDHARTPPAHRRPPDRHRRARHTAARSATGSAAANTPWPTSMTRQSC